MKAWDEIRKHKWLTGIVVFCLLVTIIEFSWASLLLTISVIVSCYIIVYTHLSKKKKLPLVFLSFIMAGLISSELTETKAPKPTSATDRPISSHSSINTEAFPFVEPNKGTQVSPPVRGAKTNIEVKVIGSGGCFQKNLEDSVNDLSALLGEGSLRFLAVECNSGNPESFGIDADIPSAIRSADISELPQNLLSIGRRVSSGFPRYEVDIGWFVRNESRSESLAHYDNVPDRYESFKFMNDEIVKQGKWPAGCNPELEDKIVDIVKKRTGLQAFEWAGLIPSLVSCDKNGKPLIWALCLDLPIEKVPPPFIENELLPQCELCFKDIENEAGKAPPMIPVVIRSENIAVGVFHYKNNQVTFERYFPDVET